MCDPFLELFAWDIIILVPVVEAEIRLVANKSFVDTAQAHSKKPTAKFCQNWGQTPLWSYHWQQII